jgi:dipeptidyl-peptidase-4
MRPIVFACLVTVVGSVAVLLSPCMATAQGTAADYQRANDLFQRTRDKVFKDGVEAHWLEGGERFWYRNDLADGAREFVFVDAAKGTREAAFDHAKLAMALGEKLSKKMDAGKLPFDGIEFLDDAAAFRFKAEGKAWKFVRATGELAEIENFDSPREARGDDRRNRRGNRGRRPNQQGFANRGSTSPNGKWRVVVRDHNLVLRSREGDATNSATREEAPLTTDGTSENSYEEGVFWSPDSARFIALQTQKGEKHEVHIVESSPRDQVQPKLRTFDYLKPGDRIPQTRPRLFDVATKKRVAVNEDLFSNPWSIDNFRWSADSSRFTFLYNQRGHQVLRIVAIDGRTGETGTIIDETSKTFVDYAHKQFSHYFDATHEIIWMSERDGWNHLYLYDSQTGGVKNQITRGDWIVRAVERIDDEKRQIWFRASGVYPEQDPYYIHFGRVNFDGSGLVWLTSGNGTHDVEYSPDGRWLVARYSRVDMPAVTELRNVEDGKLVCELERGDCSTLVETGWQPMERFTAKGRDGTTDIYGVICRPTNFDATKKYPVIEHIYAGPQGSFVPKSFSAHHHMQSLAELGFIVVQIDGMGTSNRSKAFHDVCFKNLGDSGFPDRIAWLKKAAETRPYMDLSRVGIFGGSAGGQSALRALLAHGDFYKAAVADCGCHDNRMDKIWWNELWMSWPIGPHYAEQSNVTQAHKLTGKLLLIVGELDNNVDPASTMQVVNALVRADKDFELLVVPGAGHGIGSGPYGERRRRDFFVRSLWGVEPRR